MQQYTQNRILQNKERKFLQQVNGEIMNKTEQPGANETKSFQRIL